VAEFGWGRVRGVGQLAGPPHPPADVQVERGHQDRADDDGVEQNAEGDREADFGRLPGGRRRALHGIHPEFTDAMDAMGRGVFDAMLLDSYLPLAPGLTETLAAGAHVADVACGTGHALVILARAFLRRPSLATTSTSTRSPGPGRKPPATAWRM
jgi:hypothetical protein